MTPLFYLVFCLSLSLKIKIGIAGFDKPFRSLHYHNGLLNYEIFRWNNISDLIGEASLFCIFTGKKITKEPDMKKTSLLSAGMEDYLEAIYNLTEEKRVARVKDIAERLSVSAPSVSAALKSLLEKGVIDYESHGPIFLTVEGEVLAKAILHKHKVLKSFLHDYLKVEAEKAEIVACELEHSLDEDITKKLVKFLKNIDKEK